MSLILGLGFASADFLSNTHEFAMVYTRWCGVSKIIQLAAERVQPSNRLVPSGQNFAASAKVLALAVKVAFA